MAKLKTPEQKEKERDKRLQKTYGISSFEYELLLLEQNYGCAICGSDGGERRLHVDHDHSYTKVKIKSTKEDHGWEAETIYRGLHWTDYGTTKSEAIQNLRRVLQKASIRALLCWPCNRALQAWRDKPELMELAAQYLRDFTGEGPTT
jgi:hypothetical protein